MISVGEQLRALMFGTAFGDAGLGASMARELHEALTRAEKERRPLRVYAGYDPSRPDLHLGHSLTMRKLRQFQDFGHEVTFLVGTFTAQVGDTSDKATGRPRLAPERVTEAARTYADQAFRILDRERTIVASNADWLTAMPLHEFLGIAAHFTVQQFLVRDNYRKRLAANDPVGLHEFFYALLQGYDAVHLRADVQLGATEQLFNMMAGRKLQESFGQPPAVCLTFPILVGTDGERRMSKSSGNYIGLSEEPSEQFGKTMSISDETMLEWMKYVTRWSPDVIEARTRDIRSGVLHPMEAKRVLAAEIVSMYHGDDAAAAADAEFSRVHQQRGVPESIEVREVRGPANIIDVLTNLELADSRGKARRLIEGGGVRVDGEVVGDHTFIIDREGVLLQVGKRQFFRLSITR